MKLSIDTKHVYADLRALQKLDINAFGRVAALVQELYDGQDSRVGQSLIDQLNIQGRDQQIGSSIVCNSLKIAHEKLYRDLWRLKLWIVDGNGNRRLEPYRIIYGFFSVSQYRKIPEIRIFAIPYRGSVKEDSYDYQHDHPISIRVRAAYDLYV